HRLQFRQRINRELMEPWNKRFLQAVFLPGGAILLGAFLLLNPGLVNPSVYGVRFFYYAVFIAALLLSWRFPTTRIFLSAIVLLLAHRALEFFSQARLLPRAPGGWPLKRSRCFCR